MANHTEKTAMPGVYERIFRVRHYECDAYGHVNHANYLRYMQEATLDASAAVGYTEEHYAAMGLNWTIRETSITYVRPLRFGDSVTVKTWVADARRARLRRMHELRHTESGERVAEASTDWILLDGETSRPVKIPPGVVEAYLPGGTPKQAPVREPFPAAPPPPPGVFKSRRRAQWRDIDPLQHVNNATYLAYLEDIGVDVCAAHGWPMGRMMEEDIGIVARRLRIAYRLPAVLGDELEIATWASDAKRATAVRHYGIKRLSDDARLARASVLWVWVNLSTGRPIRIPPGFLSDFAPNFADPAA